MTKTMNGKWVCGKKISFGAWAGIWKIKVWQLYSCIVQYNKVVIRYIQVLNVSLNNIK